jgi:CHRD domain
MRGRQRLAIIALLLLVATVAVAGTAGAVQAQGRPLSTTLTGAAEIPGPGDPDGSGTATLTVNPGLGQICYELTVSGIAPATAAHIHVGAAGVAGPVVVPLAPPTDGTSSGCAEVSRELALAILKSPSDYYVNVHNAEFPAGAVRGQLSK